MKIINEHVIYHTIKGEAVPAISAITRSSQDVAQVDGPDFASLVYMDASDPGAFRHDLKAMSRYADAVPHFSHPIVEKTYGEGKLLNCWMTPAEASDLKGVAEKHGLGVAIAIAEAQEKAEDAAPGTVASISRDNALPIPKGLPEGVAMTQLPTPKLNIIEQLENSGPAPDAPHQAEAAPEADPA